MSLDLVIIKPHQRYRDRRERGARDTKERKHTVPRTLMRDPPSKASREYREGENQQLTLPERDGHGDLAGMCQWHKEWGGQRERAEEYDCDKPRPDRTEHRRCLSDLSNS